MSVDVKKKNNQKWNDIFSYKKIPKNDDRVAKKRFNGDMERNKQIYYDVEKENYATLNDCVVHAIENENHTAFVHFFMEKCKTQKEVFCGILNKYLEQYSETQKADKKLPNWGQFQILNADYWRTYNFELSNYIDKELKKYCYSSSMLSNWRYIENQHIPDKDAIVQCCLYLGKSVEETNTLLIAAGRTSLYELDVVDAVSIYYLTEYCGKFDVSGFEKIKIVKEKINLGLKNSFTEDMVSVRKFAKVQLQEENLEKEEKELITLLSGQWEGKKLTFKNLRDYDRSKYKIKYIRTYPKDNKERLNQEGYEHIYIELLKAPNYKYIGSYLKLEEPSNYFYRFEKKVAIQLGQKSKLGNEIEKEIKEYREILEQIQETSQKDIGDTNYLTVLYKANLLEQIENKDIKAYLQDKQLADEGKWILYQKRYGYLKKTMQYLNSYQNYKKNLQYSSCELIARGKISIEKLTQRGRFLNLNYKQFLDKIDEKKIVEIEDINKLMQIVNAIWETKDAINELSYKQAKKSGKGNYKVKSLIEGRNLVERQDCQADLEDVKQVYSMDLTDKISLMKYAIATGQEDEIGIYLKYAGFWEKNVCAMQDVENRILNDRIDMLLLYALKYREALLEKWAEGQNITEFKIHARKEFPFIKLLMIINRDIQFVNENCLPKDKKIQNLKDILIYSIEGCITTNMNDGVF